MAVNLFLLILAVSFALSSVRGEFNLTIVHISDFHSHWFEFDENKHDCSKQESEEGKCYGGFARLLSFVRDIREKEKNVLVLSSGEFFLGRSLHALDGWKLAHALLPSLELDAMSLSNHDFDSGILELSAFLYSMKFPILCANMEARNTSFLFSRVNKSAVIDVDGRKVGIVGYIHRNALMKTKNMVSLKFLPEIPAIQEEVSRLEREGVDKIIALGHAGYYTDLEIARKVKGVDVVIGGDSDIMLFDPGHDADESLKIGNIHGNYPRVHHQEPEIENDTALANKTLLLHIPQHGMYVGVLRATFDEQGKIIHESGEPVLLDSSIPQDQETLDFLQYAKGSLEKLSEHTRLPDKAELLGRALEYLDGNPRNCRMRECSFGNFIADAMLHEFTFHYRNNDEHRHETEQWGPIDAVVFNSGSIKRSIEPGYITIDDILKAVSLGGFIKRVHMSGKHLTDMMEHSVKHYDPMGVTAPGAFLQVSGLKVEYDLSQPPGNRVKRLTVRCRDCGNDTAYFPVKLYKTYIIGMPVFLRDGRDGFYDHFDDTEPEIDQGQFDALLLVEYLRRMYEIVPVLDGRIKFSESTDVKNVFKFTPLPLGDPTPEVNDSEYSSGTSASKHTKSAEENNFKYITLNEFMNKKTAKKMEDVADTIDAKDALDSLNSTNETKSGNIIKAHWTQKGDNEEIRQKVDANEISINKVTAGGIHDKLNDNLNFADMKRTFNAEDEFKNKKTIDEEKTIVDKNIGSRSNLFQEAENVVNSKNKLIGKATTEETLSTVGKKSELMSKVGTVISDALKSDVMSKVTSGMILQTSNYVDDIIDGEIKTAGNEETKHSVTLNNDTIGSTASPSEISIANKSNVQSKIGKEFKNNNKPIVAENFSVQEPNHPMTKNFNGVKNQDVSPIIINLIENMTTKSISKAIPESKANKTYFNVSSTESDSMNAHFVKTDDPKKNLTKNGDFRPSLDELYRNVSVEESVIKKRSVPEDIEGVINKTIVAENFKIQDTNHPMTKNFTSVKNQHIPPSASNLTESMTEKSIPKANEKHFNVSPADVDSMNALFVKTDDPKKNLTKNGDFRPSLDELNRNISVEENEIRKRSASVDIEGVTNGSTTSPNEISTANNSNFQSKIGKMFESNRTVVTDNFTVQDTKHPMTKNFTGFKNQDIHPIIINLTENMTEKSISKSILESKANETHFNVLSTESVSMNAHFVKSDDPKKNLTRNGDYRPSLDELYSNLSVEESEIRKRSIPGDIEGVINKTNKLDYKDYLSLLQSYIKDFFPDYNKVLPTWTHFRNSGQNNESGLEVNNEEETKVPSQNKEKQP